jgi:aspartyl-tRNA(Asn)/glutamyl-tRNA(Gln) amidotransferase subunit C
LIFEFRFLIDEQRSSDGFATNRKSPIKNRKFIQPPDRFNARTMSLTRDDVEKVSLLARLLLSESELDTMTTQLGRVLDYVQQLDELNTEGVEPMAHAIDLTNVFADDVVESSLDRGAALANAPKRDDECYRVPAVLGE